MHAKVRGNRYEVGEQKEDDLVWNHRNWSLGAVRSGSNPFPDACRGQGEQHKTKRNN